MSVVQFKKEDGCLLTLVDMVSVTNQVSLDRVINVIRNKPKSYKLAHESVQYTSERILRAVKEVGLTLPEAMR